MIVFALMVPKDVDTSEGYDSVSHPTGELVQRALYLRKEVADEVCGQENAYLEGQGYDPLCEVQEVEVIE